MNGSLVYVNPSQILSLKRSKRTRSSPDNNTDPHKPKKKKANRACFHCQKAHLTCDDSRPCQRCIKRGISSNCTEGLRKKAKYLLDEHELEQLKRTKSESSTEPPSVQSHEPFSASDSLFDVNFDANFPFGSEAANSEYSMLSAILGNITPTEHQSTPPPPQLQYAQSLADNSWQPLPQRQQQYPHQPPDNPSPYPELSIPPPQPSDPSSAISPNFVSSYPHSQYPQQLNDHHQIHYPPPPHYGPQLQPLQAHYSQALSRHSPTSSSHHGSSDLTGGTHTPPNSQLQSINDRVTAPHDYTQGYHFLMKHLQCRFEKNDILRVIRAITIFRPSFIALQMALLVDDEVFMEKCFQRSLLELDKLISFSGTPTVVWRRTGEICLVAPEFSELTEWPRGELLCKYIYELFENQSVVEYWENFALHAFENTTQSVNSHCVLLKPSGGPIPCTFCFSVRRDLFDLPSHVVGQWLPLL